jgi:hypothetical protein
MLLRMQQLCKCSTEQHNLRVSFTSNPLNELLHGKWWESSCTVYRWMGETTNQPESALQCNRSCGRCHGVRRWRRSVVVIPRYVVFTVNGFSSIPIITALVNRTVVRAGSTSG